MHSFKKYLLANCMADNAGDIISQCVLTKPRFLFTVLSLKIHSGVSWGRRDGEGGK